MSKRSIDRSTWQWSSVNGDRQYCRSSSIRSSPSAQGIIDGSYSHDVVHWKSIIDYNGPENGDGSFITTGYPAVPGPAQGAIDLAIQQISLFSTRDLYGGFSLIETIKELPGLASLFKPSEYAKYSGYGQFKWGFKPFVQDLNSIGRAIREYADSLKNGKTKKYYTKVQHVEGIIPETYYHGRRTFKGIARFTGIAEIDTSAVQSPLQHLAHFFDQFQINPDVLTAWELTPYSFVADYYVPVSDMLDTFIERGYLSYPVSVKGYISVAGKYTFSGRFNAPGTYVINSNTTAEGRYYSRFSVAAQFAATPAKGTFKPFKGPTHQNILDTLYVASQTPPKLRKISKITKRGIKTADREIGILTKRKPRLKNKRP